MEPTNLWTQFTHFVKDSYTERIRQTSSGVLMGFIGAQHILFSGLLANLVSPLWWLIKGIGTIVLAFFTSLATSYAAYLIERHKESKKKDPIRRKKRA